MMAASQRRPPGSRPSWDGLSSQAQWNPLRVLGAGEPQVDARCWCSSFPGDQGAADALTFSVPVETGMKGVPGWQAGVILRPWTVAGAFSKGTLLNTGSALTTCSTANSCRDLPIWSYSANPKDVFLSSLIRKEKC